MLKQALQNCFMTGVLTAAVSACSFITATDGGAPDSEVPEFANDAEDCIERSNSSLCL
jgi:hypothetical protein